jgi:hypothetical protein
MFELVFISEKSLFIPLNHYLESWGDARTSDGPDEAAS